MDDLRWGRECLGCRKSSHLPVCYDCKKAQVNSKLDHVILLSIKDGIGLSSLLIRIRKFVSEKASEGDTGYLSNSGTALRISRRGLVAWLSKAGLLSPDGRITVKR